MNTESGRPQSDMISCETNEGDPAQSMGNEDDATINNDIPLLTENTSEDSCEDKAQATKDYNCNDSYICDSNSSIKPKRG